MENNNIKALKIKLAEARSVGDDEAIKRYKRRIKTQWERKRIKAAYTRPKRVYY